MAAQTDRGGLLRLVWDQAARLKRPLPELPEEAAGVRPRALPVPGVAHRRPGASADCQVAAQRADGIYLLDREMWEIACAITLDPATGRYQYQPPGSPVVYSANRLLQLCEAIRIYLST